MISQGPGEGDLNQSVLKGDDCLSLLDLVRKIVPGLNYSATEEVFPEVPTAQSRWNNIQEP